MYPYNDFPKYTELLMQIVSLKGPGTISLSVDAGDMNNKYSADFLSRYSDVFTNNNITYNVILSYNEGNIIANCSLKKKAEEKIELTEMSAISTTGESYLSGMLAAANAIINFFTFPSSSRSLEDSQIPTGSNKKRIFPSMMMTPNISMLPEKRILDTIISPANSRLCFSSFHSFPDSENIDTINPAICTPFMYMPFAFKSLKLEPKHRIIGTFLCGDCVGILGWDTQTGASFAYHMKDCDDELLAIGLARFVLATGYIPSDASFNTSLELLEKSSGSVTDERVLAVNKILELINTNKLLASAQFTFASLDKVNWPYVHNILERAGVTKNQITEIESAHAILYRKNGKVETEFEYNSDVNKLTLKKKDLPNQNDNAGSTSMTQNKPI